MWILRIHEPYDIRYGFERLKDVYDFYMGSGSDGQRESLYSFRFSGNFKEFQEAFDKAIKETSYYNPTVEVAPRHHLEYIKPWTACENVAINWDEENLDTGV